jgi:hypothetical protein
MLSPFRYPYRYLMVHWVVTLALVAVLLAPPPAATPARVPTRTVAITLITGQTVQLHNGIPLPVPGLLEHRAGGDLIITHKSKGGAPGGRLEGRQVDERTERDGWVR